VRVLEWEIEWEIQREEDRNTKCAFSGFQLSSELVFEFLLKAYQTNCKSSILLYSYCLDVSLGLLFQFHSL
jgi:hypothetical protein